jgi:hypothetical protein
VTLVPARRLPDSSTLLASARERLACVNQAIARWEAWHAQHAMPGLLPPGDPPEGYRLDTLRSLRATLRQVIGELARTAAEPLHARRN